MSSSNLKWVYGPTHRAQDVSNETVDEYKSIIQKLYLDQNMTREEVLSYLKDVYGFSLSTNQFSKATKRWGFYKQPRQVRTDAQPPELVTKEEEPPNPLEELFDFEPDVLDTIDENEPCFETGGENVADSRILEAVQGQFSSTKRHFVSEPPPSIDDSRSEAMGVDFPCEALPFDIESFKSHLPQLNTARKLQKGPHSISSKMINRVPHDNHINKSRVDYFACCYLFQEAVDCLEKSANSLGKRDHRRHKDNLLASSNISLDEIWFIPCHIEVGMPDNLPFIRLDMNDLQFMTAVRACLGLCEKWIELVGKGLPRGALQFDSLFLQQTASKAVHNICRPLHEQSRFDIWLEAGYLFAFIWSNEQLEAIKSSSWLKEAEISGLSPTHFLAITCRMIFQMTAFSFPSFWTTPCKRRVTAGSICGVYLQTIEKIKRTEQSSSRTIKEEFINHFSHHHVGLDISPEERKQLESVQSYQRTAESFVFKEGRDTLAQEVSQATASHGHVQITNSGSLSSSRSISSPSYSSRYLNHQQSLILLGSNPAMTRSLASGSSRGSSLNSFREFQAASRAMATGLKKDQGAYI